MKRKILVVTIILIGILEFPCGAGPQTNDSVLYQKALNLYLDANFEQAVVLLRQLFHKTRDPNIKARAGALLGASLAVLGRRNQALETLMQVFQLFPDFALPPELYSPRFRAIFDEARARVLKLDEINRWNQTIEKLLNDLKTRNISDFKRQWKALTQTAWTNPQVRAVHARLNESRMQQLMAQWQLIMENFTAIPGGRANLGVGRKRRRPFLKPYRMMRTPVTRALYAQWIRSPQKPTQGSLPVTGLTQPEARKFCQMIGGDLPTEDQWEFAARGPQALAFPFGRSFDPRRCNTRETGLGHLTPVNQFPNGASPFGLLDMCGNSWEWTRTLNDRGEVILKGGSFRTEARKALTYARSHEKPNRRRDDIGFRCVLESAPEGLVQTFTQHLSALKVPHP